MTNHIVNFAIGIDDEAIMKTVQENAASQIINDIKADVLNRIFTAKYYNQKAVSKSWDGKMQLDRDAILSDASEKIIKEAFAEYKEEIIERAAKSLADSYKRTKAWKEKTGEVVA